jgi:hypothetical protein
MGLDILVGGFMDEKDSELESESDSSSEEEDTMAFDLRFAILGGGCLTGFADMLAETWSSSSSEEDICLLSKVLEY